MVEQAKGSVPELDDWPLEEPGYGMPSTGTGGRPAPRPAPGLVASKSAAPAPLQRAMEQPPAKPALPFPCHARPDHFPALFARSGLFSAQRQPRACGPASQSLAIKGQAHHSVHFAGLRLSMNDKAVYEAVVRLAKAAKHDLNAPLPTSLSGIANRLGWSARGGRELEWIWDALERLAQAEVDLQVADKTRVTGKLLQEVRKGALGVEIVFDPTFVLAAFGDGQQFKIDSVRRASLGSPLAQWLHDFLSTHKDGHALTLSYLRELCGSTATSKRFCHALREAAKALCDKAPELAKSFAIDDFRRSSESWTIKFERGAEACDFFKASDFKQRTARAVKSARQRGLAL